MFFCKDIKVRQFPLQWLHLLQLTQKEVTILNTESCSIVVVNFPSNSLTGELCSFIYYIEHHQVVFVEDLDIEKGNERHINNILTGTV